VVGSSEHGKEKGKVKEEEKQQTVTARDIKRTYRDINRIVHITRVNIFKTAYLLFRPKTIHICL
jgi:hypothetical protein